MTDDEQIQDRRWVERIRDGDRSAFEALFRTHYSGMCDFVELQLGSSEAAEDIVQSIFCDLWRRRHSWDPEKSIESYLFKAARNQAIKQIEHRQVRRRWKRRETHSEYHEAVGAPEGSRYGELRQTLRQAIQALPERRRQVFVLSRRHGLTYKEIAHVMEISPSTVDNQMVAALKFLREKLSSHLTVLG